MQMITVKYVGRGDSILTEYDGIKYSFGKLKPIVEIPLAVYNHMQDYQNPHRESLVPCEKPVVKAPATEAVKDIAKKKKK